MKTKFLLYGIVSSFMIACSGVKDNAEPSTTQTVVGTYVSSEYENRAEGYDWVGVEISALSDSTAHIGVRSRVDLKKPSCRFDADASLIGKDSLETIYQGKSILFTVKDSLLTIATRQEDDINLLNFFCNGGGTIAGTYKMIEGSLDPSQADLRSFAEFFNLNNFSFAVDVLNDTLTIEPIGLEIDTTTVSHALNDFRVVGAEIGDLNIDGFPEILVYIQSTDAKKGEVIGYSVNNGKSMSQISYSTDTSDVETFAGYNGGDEFAIVESTLVRRFPIYENGLKTDRMRQIQYKLIDGEASRVLTIDKVLEF